VRRHPKGFLAGAQTKANDVKSKPEQKAIADCKRQSAAAAHMGSINGNDLKRKTGRPQPPQGKRK
jgi:hypothetical protein